MEPIGASLILVGVLNAGGKPMNTTEITFADLQACEQAKEQVISAASGIADDNSIPYHVTGLCVNKETGEVK